MLYILERVNGSTGLCQMADILSEWSKHKVYRFLKYDAENEGGHAGDCRGPPVLVKQGAAGLPRRRINGSVQNPVQRARGAEQPESRQDRPEIPRRHG